ncbi:MAG: methyltransferase domain-containing protein [Bacteroidia bacterium]
MTELELLIDLHKDRKRQGPGSDLETLKAIGFMNVQNIEALKVADIGCGSGASTLVLAKTLNAQVTAVDLFPEFLKELQKRTKKKGIRQRVSTLKKSMDDLPFAPYEYDVIWSEGAIYNMGFENGVGYWKQFLKPGGYLAISDVTWITSSRPKEIENFWKKEYPEIDTAAEKIKILNKNGFTLAGYFFLEEASWIDNYYKPLKAHFEAFLKKHKRSKKAKEVVSTHIEEIDLYMLYKEYFSYGFYVAKKNDK